MYLLQKLNDLEKNYCQTDKKIENISLHRPALFEHC